MPEEEPIVRAVSAAQTRPVRRAVLRPHQPPEASLYPHDEAAGAFHVGAFAQGALVGVASVYHERAPHRPERDAWRLRGMATLPEARGKGLGGRLLQACIAHVASQHGDLLWCNARTTASGFYLRHGFRQVGDTFDLPGLGPHWLMERDVAVEFSQGM